MPRNLAPLVLDNSTDEILVRSANGDENYASKADIIEKAKTAVGEDLPNDFIVSCESSASIDGIFYSRISYITDTKRYLYIEPDYIPISSNVTGNAISVFVEGNDIFLMWIKYPDGTTTPNIRQYVIQRINTVIIDNVLTVLEHNYFEIPTDDLTTTISPNVTLHAEGYKDGFLYYTTRETTADTRFLKINASNFEDYEVVSPFTGGGIHNIEIVDNYIYYMWIQNDNIANAYLGRIDINLKYAEPLFTINQDTSRRAYSQFPFLIYLGEIYIPVVNTDDITSLRNNLRIMVYDLNGNFLRESIEMPVATGATTLRVFPHWMAPFNGKILLHTACSSSGTKKIIRVDCGFGKVGDSGYLAPTLEESIESPARNITDDNTIISSGKVFLNSETSSTYPAERRLFIIDDYRDLAAIYAYNTDDYSSAGTPPTKYNRQSLKTKLSQFDVDINLQQVTDAGNTTTNPVSIGGIIINDLDGSGSALNLEGSDFTNFGYYIDGKAITFQSESLTAARSYTLPDTSGTIPLSVSVNGGTPATASETGNIDITVSGNTTLKEAIEEDGIATSLIVPVSIETSETVTIYGGDGVNIGDGGTTPYGTVLTTGSAPASYQNDVTASIVSDNQIPNKKYVDNAINGSLIHPKIIHHTQTEVTLTGTTTITILDSHLVSANSLTDGSITLDAIIEHVGTLAGFGLYFYLNDSLSTVGAVQLGRFIGGSTNLRAPFLRTFGLKADNTVKGFSFSDSAVNDLATSNTAPSSTAWNRTTTPKYLIIAGNVVNSADSIVLKSFKITHEPTVA